MPKVPDVSAIVESVKARIKHIEDELARYERLSDELERLRDALGRLEGLARSRVGGQRDGGRPAGRSGQRAQSGGAARSPRGGGPASRSAASGKRAGAAKGTCSTLLTRSFPDRNCGSRNKRHTARPGRFSSAAGALRTGWSGARIWA